MYNPNVCIAGVVVMFLSMCLENEKEKYSLAYVEIISFMNVYLSVEIHLTRNV